MSKLQTGCVLVLTVFMRNFHLKLSTLLADVWLPLHAVST